MASNAAAGSDVGYPCPTLAELASGVVATGVELEVVAAHFEYLPSSVRCAVLGHMQEDRLRRLERLLSSREEGAVAASPVAPALSMGELEPEFEAQWRLRCRALGIHAEPVVSTDTLFRDPVSSGRVSRFNARKIYWQHRFRDFIRAEPAATAVVNPCGDFIESVPRPNLSLFEDVVEMLKVNARELTRRNVSWILQLPRLTRLELHHPVELHKDGVVHCLTSVLASSPSLQELGFFHGRLSAPLIQQIARALELRHKKNSLASVRSLEFVSVRLKGNVDHRELVLLLQQATYVKSVRISSSISDFDNRRLVDGLLSSSATNLSLEHNDLTDDAFTGALAACTRAAIRTGPIPLQHLRLTSNAISSTTIQTLVSATLDGTLALVQLELRNNQEIGDNGIHALAPMLASGVSRLTHLDLRNCHFGLEGALTLLSALGDNRSLRSLDMSQNFFGNTIGDLLAEFLLTNQSLTHLHINYVGLGQSGCTERFLLALRTNLTLQVLSIGANRLRDHGSILITEAIAVRSKDEPFEALDLSGNLITNDGLHELAKVFERVSRTTKDSGGSSEPPSKRRRILSPDRDNEQTYLLAQLGILNNDLASSGDAALRTRDALNDLSRFVGKVHSNEWSSRRNVYDDEV